MLYLLIFWVSAILAAHYLGQTRNRTGWLWGLFLGWLGVLVLLCMQKTSPAPALPTIAEQQVREALKAQELRIAELQRQLNQSQ